MTVRNPGGHSSRPRKDNAIYELANELTRIKEYTFRVSYNDLTLAYFKGTGARTQGDLCKAMRRFTSNPKDIASITLIRANSTYVGTLGTTCVVTMLRTGVADNTLPQSATATVNCRIFLGVGVGNTLNLLKTVVSNDSFEFILLDQPTETDESQLQADVISALQKATYIKHPRLEIIFSMPSGSTDGMHFRTVGIPSCGVNDRYEKNSDSFSHRLNKRVLVKSF
jgi:carboxypeptidase PM20D1